MTEDTKDKTTVHCPTCHKEYEVSFTGQHKVYEMCLACQYAPYGEYKNDN